MSETAPCGTTHGIRSRILDVFDDVVHVFGTRWAGDDLHAYAAHFHLDPDCLFTATQVHGTDIFVLNDSEYEAIPRGEVFCDGIITTRRGLALGVRTADCAPLLLFDPVNGGNRGNSCGMARDCRGNCGARCPVLYPFLLLRSFRHVCSDWTRHRAMLL